METYYPPADANATPEFVLEVLRDLHRQFSNIDSDVDSSFQLTMTTTIKQWRKACDLMDWREIGRAYNKWWNVNVPETQWSAAWRWG